MKYYDMPSLLFKNGKWLKNPDNYICPFEYFGAGIIHTVNGEKVRDHIKWFHNKDDRVYVRDGVGYLYEKSLKAVVGRIKRVLGLKRPCGYFTEVGVYKKDNVTLYIFRDWTSRTNVSFYTDGKDAYILYGEADCCHSILSNLIGSGYGDVIERVVAEEVFSWCYENALTWISDLMYDTQDERLEGLRKLCKIFVPKEETNAV